MNAFRLSYLWLILRLLGTFFVAVLLGAAFVETLPASYLALACSCILLLLSGYGTVRLAFDRLVFDRLLVAELRENRMESFHLLIGPFAFVPLFAITCYQISLFWPRYFDSLTIRAWEKPGSAWILFALDQSFRAVALDLFETYKLHISGIEYSKGVLMPTLVFSFKTTLTVCFWKFILNFFVGWRPALKKARGK